MPKKTVCFQGVSPQEVHCFRLSATICWPLEASSPFVTPISGYTYVRVSNNKQYIGLTPGEFKPYKSN